MFKKFLGVLVALLIFNSAICAAAAICSGEYMVR